MSEHDKVAPCGIQLHRAGFSRERSRAHEQVAGRAEIMTEQTYEQVKNS